MQAIVLLKVVGMYNVVSKAQMLQRSALRNSPRLSHHECVRITFRPVKPRNIMVNGCQRPEAKLLIHAQAKGSRFKTYLQAFAISKLNSPL